MTTPVTATLYVDGARVADGAPADPDATPTALSGLSVTWGRGTTVDQVEPSTCSFEVMDPPGGSSFLDLLYTGARIDVVASAAVAGRPGGPVNADPGFEQSPVGADLTWTNLYTDHQARVTGPPAHTGRHSATIVDPAAAAVTFDSGVIPPAPPSSDPSAWDDIPLLAADQVWSMAAWLYPPVGGVVTLQPAGYPASGDQATRNGPRIDVAWSAGTPWQQAATAWTVPQSLDQYWPGVGLTLTFAAWNSIPATIPPAAAWQDTPGSWADWRNWYVDDVAMTPPPTAPATHRDVTVFSGRVTDLDAGWDFGPGTVVCTVTAADFTADLAQRDVGDVPWPAERLDDRFAHIITAAGTYTRYQIAPTLAAWRISYLDVDRQQAWPLLADLATTVDGVLWSATHRTTGPYLWLADPRVQSALYTLEVGDGGLVGIYPTAAGGRAVELDACDVLLEPVVWKQAVSDVSTRVALSWQDQTVDDAGLPSPTENTEVIVDAALELALGTRAAKVATLLTTEADAAAVAQQLLARLSLSSWRVGGLTWQTDTTDMNPDQVARALDLLDGTRRLAAPILLSNLPPWSPNGGATLPLLLQGGTYTYEGGQWTLELTTSSAAAQGASLPWNQLDPTWAWTDFDPAVAWTDLVGVAA